SNLRALHFLSPFRLNQCMLQTGLSFLIAIFLLLQTASAPPQPPPEAVDLRTEVQRVEKALPKITDRGAALFLEAKFYARLGELPKALALLKECVALNEGFDLEGSPSLEPLRSNPEFHGLAEQVRRRYPPVHKARVAYTVPEKDLFPE